MNLKLAPLAFAVLTAVGCSTTMVEPLRNEVKATTVEAEKQLETIRTKTPARREAKPAERDPGIYLPSRKVTKAPEQHPEGSRQITINREFRTIQEVAERVTLLTGVPVTIAPDAANATPGSAFPGMTGAPGMLPGGAAGGLPPLPSMPAPGGMPGGANTSLQGMAAMYPPASISYSGSLSGFLDVVSARFNISWQWNGKNIRFFRFVTKTMQVVALPGDTSASNTISNQSGSSSSGSGGSGASGTTTATTTGTSSGSSSQQVGVTISGLSVWSAMQSAISNMLSKEGKVSVSAATGTVTVTDTPQVVAQVESYIEQQNASLGRMVTVNVRVLSVDLSKTDQYGINWTAVYNALSGNFGWTFGNVFSTDSAASNLTLKILSTAGQATNSSIKSWAGSEAMISALSTQGDVSQITSGSVTTLNNQMAPLQVGHQTAYLQSSSTTITANVGATTTLQPGLVTTGFSMNIVPHILDKGRLMLQYTINLSSLAGMQTVSSNGSSIQTPSIDTRDFLQRVMLNSGDTIVMAGFEQTQASANTQGMGNPDNVALGGGLNGRRSRNMIVIIMQPVIQGI